MTTPLSDIDAFLSRHRKADSGGRRWRSESTRTSPPYLLVQCERADGRRRHHARLPARSLQWSSLVRVGLRHTAGAVTKVVQG
jgi:hypothetical protein